MREMKKKLWKIKENNLGKLGKNVEEMFLCITRPGLRVWLRPCNEEERKLTATLP